jgi:hypothetical protein
MPRTGSATPTADGWAPAWLRPLVAGLLVLAALPVLHDLSRDLARGGNRWKQGDWLINLGAGPLRRGPLGSALLWVSHVTGLDPVALVVALQAALLLLLLALVLRAVWRHLGHPAVALLWLSPGVFPLFWAGDPQGSLRKEVLPFVALGVVVAAQVRAKPGLAPLFVAVAILLVGVLGHEGSALLAPLFAGVLVVALVQRGSGRALTVALPALALVGTTALGLYAIRHPMLADTSLLCEPVQEGGPPRWFCRVGAIAQLHSDLPTERARVRDLRPAPALAGFALTYALAAAPILYAVACCRRRRILLLLFGLTGLAIAPLFAVGADWGRWIDLHLTGFAFLFTSLLLAGWTAPLRPVRLAAAAPLLLLGLLWSPAHGLGIKGPLRATRIGVWLDGRTWRGVPSGMGRTHPARHGPPTSR